MKRLLLVISGLLLLSGNMRAGIQPMLMRLMADGNQMHNETVLYFDSAGSYTYNSQLDAPSLGVTPGQLNIVSVVSGIEYQVKALPALQQNISIPLKVSTGTTGSYDLYATELQNLPHAAAVKLYDNYTHITFDLRTGHYFCVISDTETVARFTLEVAISSMPPFPFTVVAPTCLQSGNGKILLSVPAGNHYDFFWKDSLNNIIDSAMNQATDSIAFLNSGVYRLDMNISGTVQSAVQYFSLVPTSSPVADFSVPTNSVMLTSNAANVQFTNKSSAANTYWWDFGDGMGCDSVSPTYGYVQLGTYTVTLTAMNNLCPETSSHSEVITVQGGTTAAHLITNAVQLSRDERGFYLKSETCTKVVIEIVSIDGRKIWNGELGLDAGSKRYLNDIIPETGEVIAYLQASGVQKLYKLIGQR